MPNYTYKNKETGEETTVWMSMSEHETYLDDKPHLEQMIMGSTIVDPANIGVQKPPSDFQKYVLGKIRDNAPGANKETFGKRWNIPKEI
jgi:hypothetical protein